jgi:hypothetical protein
VGQRLKPDRLGGSRQIGWSNDALPNSTVEIFGPREPSRTVMFLHRERQLAAAVLLSSDSAPPATIILRKTASLSGRIVDRQNKPVSDLGVSVGAVPAPGAQPLPGWVRDSLYYTHQLANVTTGPDGAFRIEQVPPGVAYAIYARRGAEETTTPVVQPGEALDLGDVVLEEPKDEKKPQAKAAVDPPAPVQPGNSPLQPGARNARPSKSGLPTNPAPEKPTAGEPSG